MSAISSKNKKSYIILISVIDSLTKFDRNLTNELSDLMNSGIRVNTYISPNISYIHFISRNTLKLALCRILFGVSDNFSLLKNMYKSTDAEAELSQEFKLMTEATAFRSTELKLYCANLHPFTFFLLSGHRRARVSWSTNGAVFTAFELIM
jgi:hypothetical protein